MANKSTLHEQIAAKRTELIETRRSHAAGELVNPSALGRIRKEIARLHTELNAPAAKATSSNEKDSNKDKQSKKGAEV